MARVLGVAAVGAVFLQATPGRTEEGSEADWAQVQYRKADEAMAAEEWERARDLLLELWERVRSYDVAASLSEVENRLGNTAVAARYLAFTLENLPPRETPETVERIRAALQAMKERVATIRFRLEPEEADLRIDGQPLEIAPLPAEVYVEPGSRTFAALLGKRRAVQRLVVAPGEEYEVLLRLEEEQASTSTSIETEASAPATLAADGDEERSALLPVYVGAGVTAAGLAGWIGFGAAMRSARSDLDAYASRIGVSGCAEGWADATTCGQARDALGRQRRYALLGNVSMAVAATAGLATAAYLLFWPRDREGILSREPHSGWAVAPTLDGTGAGLGLFGEF